MNIWKWDGRTEYRDHPELPEPVEPGRVDPEPVGARPRDYCGGCGYPVAIDRAAGAVRCPNCRRPLEEPAP